MLHACYLGNHWQHCSCYGEQRNVHTGQHGGILCRDFWSGPQLHKYLYFNRVRYLDGNDLMSSTELNAVGAACGATLFHLLLTVHTQAKKMTALKFQGMTGATRLAYSSSQLPFVLTGKNPSLPVDLPHRR
jgi:hypothetical protein